MLDKLIDFISLKILSPIKFDRLTFLLTGRYYNLTPKDRDACKDLMEQGHYIWLSRRKTHLTTYLIILADFALGIIQWIKGNDNFPKLNLKKYTHAFFNITDDMLIEAIGKGVTLSYFDSAFDCDWICALKIDGLSSYEWKVISVGMVKNSFDDLGKKYDTKFNINEKEKLSCVELIRVLIVESIGNDRYSKKMYDFEKLIQKYGNLTPQMIRDSSSFKVVLEIKR